MISRPRDRVRRSNAERHLAGTAAGVGSEDERPSPPRCFCSSPMKKAGEKPGASRPFSKSGAVKTGTTGPTWQ